MLSSQSSQCLLQSGTDSGVVNTNRILGIPPGEPPRVSTLTSSSSSPRCSARSSASSASPPSVVEGGEHDPI
jgi:hypothetical protein